VNEGLRLPSIPTWRVKHSRELLEEKARDQATFDRGFRMRAVSPGELLFPSFGRCCIPGASAAELWRRRYPTYVGVDLSGKKRRGNAIVAVGLDMATRRRNLLEVRAGAWRSPETASVLADVCSHHDVQFIQVENNGYQQSLIDWVQQEKVEGKVGYEIWMKIEAYTTGTGKFDPLYGLPGLEVEFKNGAWVFPLSEWEAHPPTCVCDWCHLRDEFRDYPAGSSTDIVMATHFARDALNKWAHLVGPQRSYRGLNTR
jgi:hypothetical protein